jgi:hypothetical protein
VIVGVIVVGLTKGLRVTVEVGGIGVEVFLEVSVIVGVKLGWRVIVGVGGMGVAVGP